MPNMSLKKNEMPVQDPMVRNHNFSEVALGYTEEQALDEAERCLHCKNKPCVGHCPVAIDIPDLSQRFGKRTTREPIKLSISPALCPPCAAVCVLRRPSARANASGVSRESL